MYRVASRERTTAGRRSNRRENDADRLKRKEEERRSERFPNETGPVNIHGTPTRAIRNDGGKRESCDRGL